MKPREAEAGGIVGPVAPRQLRYHAEVAYRFPGGLRGSGTLQNALMGWMRERDIEFDAHVVGPVGGVRHCVIVVSARDAWPINDWLDMYGAIAVPREGVDCRPQWVKDG